MKTSCTDAMCRRCFARIHDGDRSAIDELYDAAASALYRFAWSYCRNDSMAEDVVQETMIRAVQYAAKHPNAGGKTWLFTIARNCCVDLLRLQRTAADEPETAVETDFSPVEVQDALGLLTESERQVMRCAIPKLRAYYSEREESR